MIANSKFETLNSKQIQSPNDLNSKPVWTFEFGISDLFRISNLGLRIFSDRRERYCG